MIRGTTGIIRFAIRLVEPAALAFLRCRSPVSLGTGSWDYSRYGQRSQAGDLPHTHLQAPHVPDGARGARTDDCPYSRVHQTKNCVAGQARIDFALIAAFLQVYSIQYWFSATLRRKDSTRGTQGMSSLQGRRILAMVDEPSKLAVQWEILPGSGAQVDWVVLPSAHPPLENARRDWGTHRRV